MRRGFTLTELLVVVAIVGIIVAICMVAVVDQKPSRGCVTGKRFVPAHTTCMMVGEVPVSTYYPDAWEVTYLDDSGTTWTRSTSHDFYNRLQVGRYVNFATGSDGSPIYAEAK